MTRKLNQVLLSLSILFIISCGGDVSDIDKKKQLLHDKKQQLSELKADISKIEKELMAQDSSYAKEKDKSVLVAVNNTKKAFFAHKVQTRGAVASRKNVVLSAETMAKVTSINVKEGQMVKAGQVLLELDADILRNSIQELKTSLELATTLFEKQKNLWDRNIGTEVQFLQAKNQKESLEKKLNTTYSQLDNYRVKAPFAGQINELDVKKGEMLSPGMPVCRVVSLEEMYIRSEVSENFVGKFNVGDSLVFEIPAIGVKAQTKIKSIARVINEQNRTFRIEVELPKKFQAMARPNQVTVLTLTDYVNQETITVPSKIVQKDAQGNYIYVVKKSNIGLVASKRHVSIGKSYNSKTEIIKGIEPEEQILVEGYRDVADGTIIKIKG